LDVVELVRVSAVALYDLLGKKGMTQRWLAMERNPEIWKEIIGKAREKAAQEQVAIRKQES
jgi:hypothetical protein